MIDLHFGFPNIFGNFFIIIITLFIVTVGIWLWALIDCITSKKDTGEKLIWALIIIFLNIIGAIMYLILGSGKKENYFVKSESTSQKTNKNKEKTKRLYRSRTDKIIGGVCGGVANYFNIDPVFIRLIFVLLFLLKGSGVLIYIIAWIIMPLEEEKNEKIDKNNKTNTSKKSKNIGLILFFIILGLIIFSFIGSIMFYSTANKASVKFIEVIEEKRTKDDRNIVDVTYDIDKMREIAETRILNDYNYIVHNGHELQFLGISKSNECENKRVSCNNLHYEFKINSEELTFIEGFKVNFLMQGNNYINIEFIEMRSLE